MNIHHLELFYYVARFGGISEAVRNISYGIQQPAVSGQILQLEDFLGVTLFRRRPFALTPAGEELYRFIRPFFDNLDPVSEKIRGRVSVPLRVAASSVILRDYLPEILTHLREKYPQLKLTLREGLHPQVESWLQGQEIDLAITLLEGKPPAGIKTLTLLSLPLVLLVPKKCRYDSASALWEQDKISDTLISLPANEGITKHFQTGLAKRGIVWPTGIEVDSLDLVETYVASGFGVGLSVAIPKKKLANAVRPLDMTDFDPVVIGALWRGKLTEITSAFLDELRLRAELLSS
jgi:DNA-binding transcriptional LysR family regulator